MNNVPLLEVTSRKSENFLLSNRTVASLLGITALGLLIIAGAVAVEGDNPITVWLLVGSAVVSAGSILFIRYGITTPGRLLLPGILTIVVAVIAFQRGGLYHISVVGFPVIIVLAGLLIGSRGAFVFATLSSVAGIMIGYADINGYSPFAAISRTGYDDIAVAAVLFFTTATAVRMIIERLTDSLREMENSARALGEANLELQLLQRQLEERVELRTNELQRRVTQLQTISQVARAIANIQSQEEMLPRITELISRNFGVYHTGIFLVDERDEYAVFQAANSVGGKMMLARGHRLKVGEQGIVGYVTSVGTPRIALDVGDDAVHFNNPDLPETRSELALPLKLSGQTFGALDLQSTEPNAFRDEDMQTLSILADQVAIAIQNVRSLEKSFKATEDAEAAYRQLTGQIWGRVPSQRKITGFEYDGDKVAPIELGNTDVPAQATEIPIRLRGQAIGKIKLSSLGAGRTWTPDEIAMAQAAAERTALALENARLLEESLKRATLERTIGTISTKIGTATKVDEILRSTVQELGQQLGNTEITLELESEQEAEA